MNYEIPETMKAWVLGDPGEMCIRDRIYCYNRGLYRIL